jgi:hypothetical protein
MPAGVRSAIPGMGNTNAYSDIVYFSTLVSGIAPISKVLCARRMLQADRYTGRQERQSQRGAFP